LSQTPLIRAVCTRATARGTHPPRAPHAAHEERQTQQVAVPDRRVVRAPQAHYPARRQRWRPAGGWHPRPPPPPPASPFLGGICWVADLLGGGTRGLVSPALTARGCVTLLPRRSPRPSLTAPLAAARSGAPPPSPGRASYRGGERTSIALPSPRDARKIFLGTFVVRHSTRKHNFVREFSTSHLHRHLVAMETVLEARELGGWLSLRTWELKHCSHADWAVVIGLSRS